MVKKNKGRRRDARFAHVTSDPRYHRVPNQDKSLVADERFRMDERFSGVIREADGTEVETGWEGFVESRKTEVEAGSGSPNGEGHGRGRGQGAVDEATGKKHKKDKKGREKANKDVKKKRKKQETASTSSQIGTEAAAALLVEGMLHHMRKAAWHHCISI